MGNAILSSSKTCSSRRRIQYSRKLGVRFRNHDNKVEHNNVSENNDSYFSEIEGKTSQLSWDPYLSKDKVELLGSR